MEYRQVQVRNLPGELVEQIGMEISEYSIALVVLKLDRGVATANLIGSGTLVQLGGVYGILTANHVTSSRAFLNCDRLGLTLKAEWAHHFSIPRDTLSIIPVGTPEAGLNHPDLSLIILPATKVADICAKMVFWNLESHRNANLEHPRDISEGAWILFGCPAENTHAADPERQFVQVTQFECMTGFGGVSREWQEGSFDYLDFEVSYDEHSESPSSFGGCSGGGLWQAQLIFKDGTICHERPILLGVAFYPSDIIENKRIIICHGRSSIYRSVNDALKGLQE